MDRTWHVPGYLAVRRLDPAVVAVRVATGERVVVQPPVALPPAGIDRLVGLRAPNLVAILDVVEVPAGIVVVTELVDGVSLAATLDRHGPLEPESALCLLLDAVRATTAVRRRGTVVHCGTAHDVLVTAQGAGRVAAHAACGIDLSGLLPAAAERTVRCSATRLTRLAEDGYGADWEERGRRGLRRRVALLPALSAAGR